MNIAHFIDAEMARQGIDAAELARRSGLDPSVISKILTKKGNPTLPKPATIRALAKGFGIDGGFLTAILGYPIEVTQQTAENYAQLARELTAFPWLVERWPELVALSPAEFSEAMDYVAFRRRQHDP